MTIGLEAVNYFHKKSPSYLFERVLITPRKLPYVHKNFFQTSFGNFKGKTPVLETLFKKAATLLKRDSSTSVFL